MIEVYEGELKGWNRLTEEFEFDQNGKQSDEVIGYVGYFELLNGFQENSVLDQTRNRSSQTEIQ